MCAEDAETGEREGTVKAKNPETIYAIQQSVVCVPAFLLGSSERGDSGRRSEE